VPALLIIADFNSIVAVALSNIPRLLLLPLLLAGVLVVPALLIIADFNSIVAVALSNISILSSAVANMLFNLPRKSPYRPGPLIDWDLVLLLGPPTVIGSIAGSYVNM
jgi:uncharacterized membrane protein YfcA